MAQRKVIWSHTAQNDRREILKYWKQRNKSTDYSKKLQKLFSNAIKQIKAHPGIGSPTQIQDVRIKVVRDYLIVYQEIESELHLLAIFDSRRDPEVLKKKLGM